MKYVVFDDNPHEEHPFGGGTRFDTYFPAAVDESCSFCTSRSGQCMDHAWSAAPKSLNSVNFSLQSSSASSFNLSGCMLVIKNPTTRSMTALHPRVVLEAPALLLN